MVTASMRHGLRKVRQRYGTDDFAGAFAPLAGSQLATGLMRWEDYRNQGVFGDGSYFRTGNGEARPNTTVGPGDGDAVDVIDTGYADGWLSVQLLDGLPGYGGLIFRLTDGNNWWQLYTDADHGSGGGNIYLTKFVAGVGVAVWNLASTNNVLFGDVLRVHFHGTTIDAYLNDTLIHTVVDGFNNTATRHGVYGNTYVAGARRKGAGLDNFSFAPTKPALPAVPAVALLGQVYNNNAAPALTQTVNLPAGVAPTDTVAVVIFEFPADTAAVTSVTGLGGLWARMMRITNADRMGLSVWVATNLTGPDTSITAHSSANQTNEINASRWSGLSSLDVSVGVDAPGFGTDASTGIAHVTTGRLVIGGVATNGADAPAFTDHPAAWTNLTGSADFYPAYRIVTAPGDHYRTGVRTVVGWNLGTACEIN